MPDYLITTTTGKPDQKFETARTERLVRARNEARALAHVVKDTIKAERASIDDVIRATKDGIEMEEAE